MGVLGACKAFPKFNRSLSVSSKTALIATPFFGTFVLLSELELNACAKRAREARLLLSQQQKRGVDGGRSCWVRTLAISISEKFLLTQTHNKETNAPCCCFVPRYTVHAC